MSTSVDGTIGGSIAVGYNGTYGGALQSNTLTTTSTAHAGGVLSTADHLEITREGVVGVYSGLADPTNVTIANPGSLYLRNGEVAGRQTLYMKRSAAGYATEWQSVQETLFYNIISYGAIPGTDSTTAIQAAVDAAGAGAIPYAVKKVVIPQGLYYVSSSVTVPANVSIEGAVYGQCTVQATTGAPIFILSNESLIRGITLNGVATDGTLLTLGSNCQAEIISTVSGFNGIDVVGSNVIIRDCKFRGLVGSYSVKLKSGCGNVTIDAIHTNAAGGANFSGVEIEGNAFKCWIVNCHANCHLVRTIAVDLGITA